MGLKRMLNISKTEESKLKLAIKYGKNRKGNKLLFY